MANKLSLIDRTSLKLVLVVTPSNTRSLEVASHKYKRMSDYNQKIASFFQKFESNIRVSIALY